MKPSRKPIPKSLPKKSQIQVHSLRTKLPAKAHGAKLQQKKVIRDHLGRVLPVTTEAEWRRLRRQL